MSRGLGQIQKKCLEALATKDQISEGQLCEGLEKEGVFDTITVAWLVNGLCQVSESHYASVRRALTSLARKGLVKNMGRSFHDNIGRWALPEAAKAYLEKSARQWAMIRKAAGR